MMSDSDETQPGKRMRKIRSYVLRDGRLTKGQQRALELYGPKMVIPPEQQVGPEVFEQPGDLVLDIGFGNGESVLHAAALQPDRNIIGAEVHTPGIGALLLGAARQKLTNIRVIDGDAVEALQRQFPDAILDEVRLYFPDPWHKKRHHKRRIVQPAFCDQIARVLKPGGLFHLATDWENYAEHMSEVLQPHTAFENTQGEALYAERPDWRPITKFERRGQRLGHGVWDLLYRRK